MIEVGEQFAGYVIERQLGAGGMGEVYVGRHPRLPRSDAIKVLGAQVSGDEQFRARFVREAELASGLSHPAIVPVHDQGEDGGRLWISMQLIDGTDVAKLAAAGPIPVPEVVRIITTVADALDFAGARGLVHRDVKPANILVSAAGHVMLTDFGIARMGSEASDLTATGVTVGTLNYASPEQLRAVAVDTRSDQYALAATAYHLLAGVPPFAGTNAVQVISGHLSAPVPPLASRRGGLPAAVDAVFARAMAKDPAQRFGSSREFAAALQAALLAPQAAVTRVAPQPALGFAPPTVHRDGPVPASPAGRRGPVRGMWLLSAGVLVLTAGLTIFGLAGSSPVSYDDSGTYHANSGTLLFALACAVVIVGSYLCATGLTVNRRVAAGAVLVVYGLVGAWSVNSGAYHHVYEHAWEGGVIAAIVVPLAWGVARRRGWRWLWSLLAAPPVWAAACWISARSPEVFAAWLDTWDPTSFALAVGLEILAPTLVVGLLGWLIDAAQHGDERVAPAPSYA